MEFLHRRASVITDFIKCVMLAGSVLISCYCTGKQSTELFMSTSFGCYPGTKVHKINQL